MFDISVRVQKSKRKGAFQIKLALDTVHFHALQRCARINEAVSHARFLRACANLKSTYRVAQADGS